MAKKKIKEIEGAVEEVIEVATEEQVEVQVEQVEEPIEEVQEVVEPIAEVSIEPTVEEAPPAEFKDNDIVLFENKKGELRYAPYKYITKRGYKAIELYKTKK